MQSIDEGFDSIKRRKDDRDTEEFNKSVAKAISNSNVKTPPKIEVIIEEGNKTKNDPLDEMSEAELIDRLGEIRQFIRDFRREDREILQKLAWGNKSKIECSAYRAVKRQLNRKFTLKRHDDGRPLACDLPENVCEQIFEPALMIEAIYVLGNVKKS